jgi:hypothetical protein
MTLIIYLFLTFRAVKAVAIATIALILTINLPSFSYFFVIMALKADSNRNEF